ncbi:hypothetical protein LRP50_25495, partial [Enterovibrio sp. ZSDZ42]|nr:hypothetical protein [Enterovibrio sp. ZSDZ42]
MFWKKKTNQELDLKQQEPKAGERRKFLSGEAVFFSPKPMPAYFMKDDDVVPSSEILDINDTYMDVGARCQGKAFQVQLGHICINAVSLLAITVLVSVAYSNSNVTGGSYFEELLRGLDEIKFGMYIVYSLLGG